MAPGSADVKITLLLSVVDGTRTGSATVTLTTSSAPLPVVLVTEEEVVVNPEDLAELEVSVAEFTGDAEDVTVTWNADSVALNYEGPLTSLFPLNPELTGTTLAIDTTQLFPGTYAFVATATDAVASSSVEVRLRVNLEPTGGRLVAEPSQGEALNDVFVFALTGWQDVDLPLEYGFDLQLITNDGGLLTVPLKQLSSESVLRAFMGPGTATIVGTVRDSLGASATTTADITASLPSSIDLENLDVAALLTVLDLAIASGRPNEVCFAIAAVAAYRQALAEGLVNAPTARRRLQDAGQQAMANITDALVNTASQGSQFFEISANDLGTNWNLLAATVDVPSSLTPQGIQTAITQANDLLAEHEINGIPLLPNYAPAAYSTIARLLQATEPTAQSLIVSLGKKYFVALLSRIDVAVSKGLTAARVPVAFVAGPLKVSIAYAQTSRVGGLALSTSTASLTLPPSTPVPGTATATVSVAMWEWNVTAVDATAGDGFFNGFWWSASANSQLHSATALSLNVVDRGSGTAVAIPATLRSHSVAWTITDPAAEGSCGARVGGADGALTATACVKDTVRSNSVTRACVCRAYSDSYGFLPQLSGEPSITATSSVQEGGSTLMSISVSSASEADITTTASLPASVCVLPSNRSATLPPCTAEEVEVPIAYSAAGATINAQTLATSFSLAVDRDFYALSDFTVPVTAALESSDLRYDTKGLCAQYSSSACTRWAAVAAPVGELTIVDMDTVAVAVASTAELSIGTEMDGEVAVSVAVAEGGSVVIDMTFASIPLEAVALSASQLSSSIDGFTATLNGTMTGPTAAASFKPKLILTVPDDDFDVEGNSAIVAVNMSTADALFAGLPTYVFHVTAVNDDVAAWTVTSTHTTVGVSDIGVTTLQLATHPLADVTVTIIAANGVEVAQWQRSENTNASAFASTLTWTIPATSWQEAVSVAFRAPQPVGMTNVTFVLDSDDDAYSGEFVFSFNSMRAAPSPSPAPFTPPSPADDDDDLSGAAIAFIVIGSIIVVAAPIAFVIWRRRRGRVIESYNPAANTSPSHLVL